MEDLKKVLIVFMDFIKSESDEEWLESDEIVNNFFDESYVKEWIKNNLKQ